MKLITSTLFVAVLSFSALHAQTGIYKTYNDFLNDNLEVMDDWMSYLHTAGTVKLKFKDNNKKVSVKCKDIWGFKYEGKLFRIDQDDYMPCRVISNGNVTYYENGIAHIMMIRTKSDSYSYSVGYYNYLSKDIGSDIVPIANFKISTAKKKMKKFKEDNPELAPLIECIEKDNQQNNLGAQACIIEFENYDSEE